MLTTAVRQSYSLYPKGKYMYLSALDLVAVMIALGVSVTLVITTAIANARLTRAVRVYRDAWLNS